MYQVSGPAASVQIGKKVTWGSSFKFMLTSCSSVAFAFVFCVFVYSGPTDDLNFLCYYAHSVWGVILHFRSKAKSMQNITKRDIVSGMVNAQMTINPKNCFYNGPAKELKDPEGVKLLNSICPELRGQRTCCDTKQIKSLVIKLTNNETTNISLPSLLEQLEEALLWVNVWQGSVFIFGPNFDY